MKCAIVQPSYLPWRGYFHLIQRADVFVFYDDVQFDKHGWRNRNRVKTVNGPAWLTVPVAKKGNVTQGTRIDEIEIAPGRNWAAKHLATIRQAYARAPHLDRYIGVVEQLLDDPPRLLADITIDSTVALAGELGVQRQFVRSSELGVPGGRMERLIGVLAEVGATHYISGPSARAYIDEDRFADAGIGLEYMTYDYPTYPQLHGPFEPNVSILDLLFMEGPDAPRFIWAD